MTAPMPAAAGRCGPAVPTVKELASEALHLAVAGELHAACRAVLHALRHHGAVAGAQVALYVVDTAMQVHAAKCRDEDASMCVWAGVHEDTPGARWVARLATARRSGDHRCVEHLLKTGTSLVDVLTWASDIIRAAHSGPRSGMLAALLAELDVHRQADWVSPPARSIFRRSAAVSKPSEAVRPDAGWLGLGLWGTGT